MTPLIRLRQAVLGLGVAGSLGFGAGSALARPVAPCNDPLATGSCRSLSDCQSLCRSRGFVPSASACRDRCCYCNVI